MDLFLFFILLFPPIQKDNYVEIEIKLERTDHIQLFIQGIDTLSRFSEKVSYWKKPNGGNFQTVRWELPDFNYRRFRIDISTKFPQNVWIKSVSYHLNGEQKIFKGLSILDILFPNGFIEFISGDEHVVELKCKAIGKEFDPIMTSYILKDLDSRNNNSVLEVEFRAIQNAVFLVHTYQDASILSISRPYTLGMNNLSFSFNTSALPSSIILQPSVGNENRIRLKKVRFTRDGKTKTWDAKQIFKEFIFNQDFDTILINNDDLLLNTIEKSGYRSASLKVKSIIFPIDLLIVKIYNFLMILPFFLILPFINRLVFKKMSI